MTLTTTSTTSVSTWSPNFVPGPIWPSFEKFRLAGSTALLAMDAGSIATLKIKSKTYRIIRDDDFQRLLGLASSVHRLKGGLTVAIKAARVVAKHPDDPESIDMLVHSVSMLSESSILPERQGHGEFQITPEEAEEFGDDSGVVRASDIPRPTL